MPNTTEPTRAETRKAQRILAPILARTFVHRLDEQSLRALVQADDERKAALQRFQDTTAQVVNELLSRRY